MTESQRSLTTGRRSVWFVVVTLFLLAVAVLLRLGLPIYRKNSAINEFRRMGGSVQTVPGGPERLRRWLGDERMRIFDDVVILRLGGTRATDGDISPLAEMPRLKELNLRGSRVTDAGLDHIRRLNDLQVLILADAHVTDAGLEKLVGLSGLKELNLRGTQITDAGLTQIGQFPELEILSLGDTHITDAGLVPVRALPALQRLSLLGAGITDAGLEQLKGLPNLERVMLYGTRVSDRGVVELVLTLPRADKFFATFAQQVQQQDLGSAAALAAGVAMKTSRQPRNCHDMFWRSWNYYFWMRDDFDTFTRDFRLALCAEFDRSDDVRQWFIAELLARGHRHRPAPTADQLRKFAEILPEYR